MKTEKNTITIIVDDEFKIIADRFNWTVYQKKASKGFQGEGKGRVREVAEAYCYDLKGALIAIMRLKSISGGEIQRFEDFLSRYDAILQKMVNTVMSRENEWINAISGNNDE